MADDLVVPVVPVYIQEKIRPRAIIEDLRRNGRREDAQLDFFADFNGIGSLERKLEFYQHDQHWSNRMILGDSLLVMTSLAEKESLRGKVQCIYLDPPYGIKFGSNWQVSTRKRDVRDGRAEDATRQPEQVRAFRDTWQLGIHSYLTYLRDRFTVARDLLSDSGSPSSSRSAMRTSTSSRSLLDEVFGSENFVRSDRFKKTSGLSGRQLVWTTFRLPALVREETRNQAEVPANLCWEAQRAREGAGISRPVGSQRPEGLLRRF